MFQFLVNNQKAQKHLLGAFELLVGKSFPEKLMPKVPRLLQVLYQNDLLEEEVLLEWAAKVRICNACSWNWIASVYKNIVCTTYQSIFAQPIKAFLQVKAISVRYKFTATR